MAGRGAATRDACDTLGGMSRAALPLEPGGAAAPRARPPAHGGPRVAPVTIALAAALQVASPATAQPSTAAAVVDQPDAGPPAAEAARESARTPARRRFVDPADGQLDLSEFLATARGFLPVPILVTEPAVGYGGGAAAMFLRPRREEGAAGWSRPDLSAVGAMATENGTWAGFAGDSSNWLGDRLRTLVGLFKGDINLDFYRPTLADPGERRSVSYSLDAVGALAEADWRLLADADWWVGLRYVYADVDPSLRREPVVPLPDDAGRVKISAPTLLLTYDARDNLFTPTQGLYASGSLLVSRETFGSSADFERFDQVVMGWAPFGRDVTF